MHRVTDSRIDSSNASGLATAEMFDDFLSGLGNGIGFFPLSRPFKSPKKYVPFGIAFVVFFFFFFLLLFFTLLYECGELTCYSRIRYSVIIV